jgi:ribosomal protein S18 acetylase RimI-like enzyme
MDGSGSKPLDPRLPDSKSRDSKPLFTIRSFRAGDLASCTALYREGLLGGKIAENDTGLDIDDIERAYMSSPGSHFWVAEAQNEVVGMIGVQHHDDDVGEIRRLRVRHDWRRRGIGSALIETALKFCQEKGYLKIALDTFVEREPAIKLFEKFHFRHHRTRTIGDKQILHFYLDLYQRDDRSRSSSAKTST